MSSIIVDEEDSEEAAAAESSKPRMSIPDEPSSSCSSILAAPERDRRMIASSLIIDLQAHHHDHVHSPDPNLLLPPSLFPPAAVSDLPLREDSCLSIHGHNPRRSRSRGVTTSWRPPVACSSCSRSRSYDVAAACMQPPPPPRPLVQWSSLPSVAAIASCNSAAAARGSSFLWDHDQHSAPRPIPRAAVAVPTQVISVTPFPSLSVSTTTRLSALFHSLQGSSSSASSGGSSSSSSTPQYSSSPPLQLSSQSAFSCMTSMSSSEATILMRPSSRSSSHTAKKLATCRHQMLQAAATASSSGDQTSAVPTLAEPRAAENNILEEDCLKQQAVQQQQQQQHGPTFLQEEEESEQCRDDGLELEGRGAEAVENSFHPSEFGDLIAESPTPGATSMRAVGQTLDPGSSIPIAAASPGAENNAATAAAGVLAHDDYDDDVIFAAAAANCRRRSSCCHGFLQSQIPAPCESPESTSSWLQQQRTLHCVLETTTSGPMSAAELLNLHSSSSSAAAAADIVVSSSSSVSEFCSSQIIQGSLDQQEHVQQSYGSASHELDKQLVINVAATSDDDNNNKTFPNSSQQQQQQSLAGRVKGQWGCAEDRIVSKLVKRYGTRRWSLISTFLASESVSFCINLLTAMLSLSSSSSPSSSSSSSSVSLGFFFLVFGFEFLQREFLCVCFVEGFLTDLMSVLESPDNTVLVSMYKVSCNAMK